MKNMNTIFTTLMTVTALAAFVACSPKKDGPAAPAAQPNTRVEGGVDVGNFQMMVVPKTHASVAVSKAWFGEVQDETLVLKHTGGSKIEAKKTSFSDLVSPSATALMAYLKAKHPERDYQYFSASGLSGVRTDIAKSETELKSEIYLVSETSEILLMAAELKKTEGGIDEGERVLKSVRVEYRGEPVKDAKSKTVTLYAYAQTGDGRTKGAYSFSGECYSYANECASGGVSILFGYGSTPKNSDLLIGAGGYDHGRIIDLGPESKVSYEDIKVDGKYLVAPQGRVHISDIYTAFSPGNRQVDHSIQTLEQGHVYLVRTISWPYEDLVTKVKVDHLDAGNTVTITYEKLVSVPQEELKKQVEAANEFTRQFEQPMSTGEVTLFNRSMWNNYFFASFNFRYSTSGNMFITNNSWDLMFEGDHFDVPHSGSEIGAVVDAGLGKSLESVKLDQFPDPNSSKGGADERVKVASGHTYLIYRYGNDGQVIYGAIRVLEIGPNNDWVRLQFRRVGIEKVGHFQKWIQLSTPAELVSVELTRESNKNTFYPFIMKRADQGNHYYEDMDFTSAGSGQDLLRVDSRPYRNERGFVSLGADVDPSTVTQQQVESLKGRYTRDYQIKQGDVVAVLLENYFDKTVAVMKVEAHVPGESVKLSFRYLERAKTSYSDDKE